jgi:glutamate--glyoxylate aminotransferase
VPGDPSYALFAREKDARLLSLQRRAEAITAAFNSCEGISCQPCQGAMYSFPSLTLPPHAVAAAAQANVAPDVFYCLALLDATGISSTPGK